MTVDGNKHSFIVSFEASMVKMCDIFLTETWLLLLNWIAFSILMVSPKKIQNVVVTLAMVAFQFNCTTNSSLKNKQSIEPTSL